MNAQRAFAIVTGGGTSGHVLPALAVADGRVVAVGDRADVEPLVHGVRLLRSVFATAPLCDVAAEELRPGAAVASDEALREYVHAAADSMFHAVGTCAMGTAVDAVTTPELRVRGVDALRVVDASVMPLVPSGNTAAAVMLLAERAADLILAGRTVGSSAQR